MDHFGPLVNWRAFNDIDWPAEIRDLPVV